MIQTHVLTCVMIVLLIPVLLSILIKRVVRKTWQLGWLTLSLGGLTLFMATKAFQWDRLAQALGPFSVLVRNLQFPWRFLAFATVFLTIASCIAVSRLKGEEHLMRQAVLVIGLLSILSTGWMLAKHMKETPVLHVYDTEGMDGYDYVEGWGTQEYLIQGTDSSLLRYNEFVPGDTVMLKEYRKEGTKVELACMNHSENVGYVDIPLLYYKGYTAVCQETGIPIGIAENENHVMRILVPGNFQGTVKIRYAGLWYWKAAYVISLLFMIGTIGYVLWHKAALGREKAQN